jgi:hypothetical protein
VHSSAWKQVAFLAYVHKLIPEGAEVFLVGDRYFGLVAVLRQFDQWNWFYVPRQKSDTVFGSMRSMIGSASAAISTNLGKVSGWEATS